LFWRSGLPLAHCSQAWHAKAQSKEAIDLNVEKAIRQFNLLDARHVTLENRAAGILIFPQVTKGGVAPAAEYGAGALQIHGATVGYYSLASASVGLTPGWQRAAKSSCS
jgi:lipid-binding SYLF domain-containing protein